MSLHLSWIRLLALFAACILWPRIASAQVGARSLNPEIIVADDEITVINDDLVLNLDGQIRSLAGVFRVIGDGVEDAPSASATIVGGELFFTKSRASMQVSDARFTNRATVSSRESFEAIFSNSHVISSGDWDVGRSGSGKFQLNDTSFVNLGLFQSARSGSVNLEMANSTFVNAGDAILTSGTVSLRDSTWTNSGSLDSNATWSLISSTMSNSGDFDGRYLGIDPNSVFTANDSPSMVVADVRNRGVFSLAGGAHRLDMLVNDGEFVVGSPMQISGHWMFLNEPSSLQLPLSFEPATASLAFTGSALLGGEVSVDWPVSRLPRPDREYRLLDLAGGETSGTFANAADTLKMPHGVFSVRYEDDAVTLFDFQRVAPPRSNATGNYYEFVPFDLADERTWDAADALAADRVFRGMPGHLATITSREEDQFLHDHWGEQDQVWIAASDVEEEGVWKWVRGPEAGEVFWIGVGDGTQVGYADWSLSEPNNSGRRDDGEDVAIWNWVGRRGWNDLTLDSDRGEGFFVEYSVIPGDADGDGVVSLDDFNVLRDNLGAEGVGFVGGDFDRNGLVDLGDFNRMRANFGASSGESVPEPSALLTAFITIGGAWLISRRR